jgi:DNA modification methylase
MIEFGDCRDIMRRWAQDGVRVQTCVTSPPYFGLRDYGHDGQIGLEETPEQYITAMIEVFRCVRDVLTDDGTVWLNIGDSYASFRDGKATPDTTRGDDTGTLVPKGSAKNRMASTFRDSGIKHKDLIGIPWMLAFALRADGWYLRQDIIWHKPNPMPESVRDRCTKAHEYIFLLSKSERYFFDSDSIRQPLSEATIKRDKTPRGRSQNGGGSEESLAGYDYDRKELGNMQSNSKGANRRSVWTVATRPYKGAHFATFPPALIEPCILAGSRPNDVVLDPFMGSGTTAMVATELNRQYLGCELNPEYKMLQEERLSNTQVQLRGFS